MSEKWLPQIGEDVYIPTALFIGHGRDDFKGGLCQVMEVKEGVSAGKSIHYIKVVENPSSEYNWDTYLMLKQQELKEEFGNERGRPDPDYEWEFNQDWL